MGIGQHIDTVEGFDGPVASVSLLSSIVINFKKKDEVIKVLVNPRDFMLFDGDSRYVWTHGISRKTNNRKVDDFEGKEYPRARRIAITFRRAVP